MPKIVYMCSECGKRFDDEAGALACEKAHKEERARRQKLQDEKESRAKSIKEAYRKLIKDIEAYNKDYNEPAEIPFTSTFAKLFDSVFKF